MVVVIIPLLRRSSVRSEPAAAARTRGTSHVARTLLQAGTAHPHPPRPMHANHAAHRGACAQLALYGLHELHAAHSQRHNARTHAAIVCAHEGAGPKHKRVHLRGGCFYRPHDAASKTPAQFRVGAPEKVLTGRQQHQSPRRCTLHSRTRQAYPSLLIRRARPSHRCFNLVEKAHVNTRSVQIRSGSAEPCAATCGHAAQHQHRSKRMLGTHARRSFRRARSCVRVLLQVAAAHGEAIARTKKFLIW